MEPFLGKGCYPVGNTADREQQQGSGSECRLADGFVVSTHDIGGKYQQKDAGQLIPSYRFSEKEPAGNHRYDHAEGGEYVHHHISTGTDGDQPCDHKCGCGNAGDNGNGKRGSVNAQGRKRAGIEPYKQKTDGYADQHPYGIEQHGIRKCFDHTACFFPAEAFCDPA